MKLLVDVIGLFGELFGGVVYSVGGQFQEFVYGNGFVFWEVIQGGDRYVLQYCFNAIVQNVFDCFGEFIQFIYYFVCVFYVCKSKIMGFLIFVYFLKLFQFLIFFIICLYSELFLLYRLFEI